MKKIIFLLTITCFIFGSRIYASNNKLAVGKKAPDWLIKGEGNGYRLTDWPNKLVIIDYIDPRYPDRGDEMIGALEEAIKSKILPLEFYQPVAVINCDTTWHPDFIIRCRAQTKVNKLPVLKPLILYDYDGIIDKRSINRNKDDASCFIVIGKKGYCRAIYRGKMSKKQIDELIVFAVNLCNESNSDWKDWISKLWEG